MFEQIIYEDIKKIYENKVIVWKKLANKKILITGANGFIVNYIINLLIFLNLEKDFKIKIFLTSRNKEKTNKRSKLRHHLLLVRWFKRSKNNNIHEYTQRHLRT